MDNHSQGRRPRESAEPSNDVPRAAPADRDAQPPAATIPGQATQEPLKTSQRETQEDESPGAL